MSVIPAKRCQMLLCQVGQYIRKLRTDLGPHSVDLPQDLPDAAEIPGFLTLTKLFPLLRFSLAVAGNIAEMPN